MSRRRPSGGLLALALLAAAAGARAEPVLAVSGAVLATEPRLEVRVDVTNRGDQPAAAVEVTGELLGVRRAARLPGLLAPGRSSSVVLDFVVTPPRPGVFPLTLLLEHPLPGTPDAAGNPPMASERAWLLVALGASADPAVRLAAQPLRLEVRGELEVSVETTDAAPHRIRLQALTARGIRPEGEAPLVDVPATGRVRVPIQVMRAGAPRGSRHGVLLVAEALDGPVARASVAVAQVEVAPDPSLLRRWRTPLLVLALAMLAIVIAAEAFRWRRGAGSA